MISVVILYSDKKIFTEWAERGLKNQSLEYELVMVDNVAGTYRSAAEAFNSGIMRATGAPIICLHQDLRLLEPTSLNVIQAFVESHPNFGVAGISGRGRESFFNISNSIHGEPPVEIGIKNITEPTEVQTLDECFFMVPHKGVLLDEITCDDWHLYAVDLCLSQIEKGKKNYVLPLRVHHKSIGYPISRGFGKPFNTYFATLEKVIAKHRTHTRTIYAPTSIWNTTTPLPLQRTSKFLWYYLSPLKILRFFWRYSGAKSFHLFLKRSHYL